MSESEEASAGELRTTVGEVWAGIRANPITPQASESIASVPPSIVPAVAIPAVTRARAPSVPVDVP